MRGMGKAWPLLLALRSDPRPSARRAM